MSWSACSRVGDCTMEIFICMCTFTEETGDRDRVDNGCMCDQSVTKIPWRLGALRFGFERAADQVNALFLSLYWNPKAHNTDSGNFLSWLLVLCTGAWLQPPLPSLLQLCKHVLQYSSIPAQNRGSITHKIIITQTTSVHTDMECSWCLMPSSSAAPSKHIVGWSMKLATRRHLIAVVFGMHCIKTGAGKIIMRVSTKQALA